MVPIILERHSMNNIGNEQDLVKLAMDSFNSGDYNSAVEYFNKALNISPNNAQIWLLKSGALSHLNRDEECINAYYQAKAIDPSIEQPGWIG